MLRSIRSVRKLFWVILIISMATFAYANLTSHTEALVDALLLAIDSDADGAITDEAWYTGFALESVVGTSLGTGLLLDSTTLKVSAILQEYHAVDPTPAGLSILDDATTAAMRTTLGVGTTDTPQFGGQTYTELTSAPGSPVIGARYLCDGVTWDPLSRVATTGAVATVAAADADPDTFTTSAQDFVALGFKAGMTLIVTGAGSNNGTYTIDSLTTTVITLLASDSLTADAEGDSVTLTGHIPYFVRYTPTGDYIGLDDYQGNLLIESINITGTINGGSPTPVSGSTTAFATTFTGQNLYGGTYVCTSDDGDLQLPLMAVGMNFCIVTAGAIQVVAATNVNDGYLLDGTTTAEDNSVVNASTAGDIACFQYYTADDWLITTNGWTTE